MLHGSFVSFAKNRNGDLLCNQSADVDLLLLNDEEFDDFEHSRQELPPTPWILLIVRS